MPIGRARTKDELELVAQPLPVVRFDGWRSIATVEPRLRGLLRFALRLINPRSGFACETHLQAWAMQQPIFGVCILQPAILDRSRYG